MSAEEPSDEPPADQNLRLPNAVAFARFLEGPEVNDSAKLIEVARAGDAEHVYFSIEVPLPQYPKADIRETETIGVKFGEGEPMVFAMRDDFPRLPHQNLTVKGSHRCLCLNATPWSETKHRWSPSSFLENIRDWLMKGALGKLHAPGQPREPLFAHPTAHMIVEEGFDLAGSDMLTVSGDLDYLPHMLWASPSVAGSPPCKGKFKLMSFRVPAREHGIIDSQPKNLLDLHELCDAQGFDFITELTERLRSMVPAGRIEDTIFGHDLLLNIQQQLLPGAGSDESTEEEWAFMVMNGKIQKIAEVLGVSTSMNGMTAPVLGQVATDVNDLQELQIAPIAILRSMTPEKARVYNDVAQPFPKVSVLGAGAIGSKTLEALTRAGLENAKIIDCDRLNPHNTARHSLPGAAVGFSKATGLAYHLNMLLAGTSEGFSGIVGMYSGPNSDGQVRDAIKASEFLLDFSASVAVSRDLSGETEFPRAFSAFLTPGGNSMIVHCEDEARQARLDWLEAITLRAIWMRSELASCYSSESEDVWYGGACREVSTVLPNYKVSMFAAIAANVFSNQHPKAEAFCAAYVLDPQTMGVTPVTITATRPIEVQRDGWTIKYDVELVAALKSMRHVHLPNETGGILIGIFDRERKTCSIVLASDSPADSESWPTEYIRGVAGLKDLVKTVADRTAGQLQYVGEWHSHPSGYSTYPSDLDRAAVANLKMVLGREGYPAVALIIGDDPLPYVLFDQHS